MERNQMVGLLKRKFIEWRRRRTLVLIRRKFAESGHPLDDLDDLNIEAALTLDECRIERFHLTGKSIYFALRRIAAIENQKIATKQMQRKN